MTFNRLSIPAPARKHARAITLCTAAVAGIAGIVTPSIASAATTGSSAAAAPAAVAATTAVKVNAAPVSDSTTSGTSGSSAAASSKTTTYTVVAGDTLFGIAQRSLGNGNDYPKLFSLNKNRSEPGGRTFTDADLIDVGWTLSVPGNAGSASGAAATTSSDSSATTAKTTASTTTTATTSSNSSSSAPAAPVYADDLNGWINQAISILAQHGYTVSYNAIYQTAMNESAGNPSAENNWDSNAAAGTPSIGLLQVIQPTFDAYALPGYGDIWNPVDNIIAGAIYAQVTYGGLDNVVAARCGGSCWFGY